MKYAAVLSPLHDPRARANMGKHEVTPFFGSAGRTLAPRSLAERLNHKYKAPRAKWGVVPLAVAHIRRIIDGTCTKADVAKDGRNTCVLLVIRGKQLRVATRGKMDAQTPLTMTIA